MTAKLIKQALRHTAMTSFPDKSVLVATLLYADVPGTNMFARAGRVAETIGCSPRQVFKTWAKLLNLGEMIPTTGGRRRRSKTYDFPVVQAPVDPGIVNNIHSEAVNNIHTTYEQYSHPGVNIVHTHLKDPLKNPLKEELYISPTRNSEASPLDRPKRNSEPISGAEIRSNPETSGEIFETPISEEKKERTPPPPPWWPEGFAWFWQAYPRKVGRAKALAAWNELKPNSQLLQQIADSLERATRSSDWNNDGGIYTPHPSTYLRDGRWTDEYSDDALLVELPPTKSEVVP
ncbi:MAG: hypothetical protein NTAFB01_21100 [Nitrospira sp.]